MLNIPFLIPKGECIELGNLASLISRKNDDFFNENGYVGYFKKFSSIGQLSVNVRHLDTQRYFSWTYNLNSSNYHIRIVNDMASLIPSPFSQSEDLNLLALRIRMEIELS